MASARPSRPDPEADGTQENNQRAEVREGRGRRSEKVAGEGRRRSEKVMEVRCGADSQGHGCCEKAMDGVRSSEMHAPDEMSAIRLESYERPPIERSTPAASVLTLPRAVSIERTEGEHIGKQKATKGWYEREVGGSRRAAWMGRA